MTGTKMRGKIRHERNIPIPPPSVAKSRTHQKINQPITNLLNVGLFQTHGSRGVDIPSMVRRFKVAILGCCEGKEEFSTLINGTYSISASAPTSDESQAVSTSPFFAALLTERYYKHTLWWKMKRLSILPKPKLPTQLSTMLLNLTERKPIRIQQPTHHHQYQHSM